MANSVTARILSTWWTCLYLCISMVFACLTDHAVECHDVRSQSPFTYAALLNITYLDPVTGHWKSEVNGAGEYSTTGKFAQEQGVVVHVRTEDNRTDGCKPIINVPPGKWIALIRRGGCGLSEKTRNAAVLKNASAVVIYNMKKDQNVHNLNDNVEHVVSVFIPKDTGEQIAQLVDNQTRVHITISMGRQIPISSSMDKPSVLFVSISFIVLMIISLAWLVFYYIQRFRYAHAKERLARRLMSAAKKAIAKMPLKTMKAGDMEVEYEYDQCAVCIEFYRVSDIIRILPCKHTFHKSCVDPWLIEQRSCPMCKMDILKALGLQVRISRESINRAEDLASTSLAQNEHDFMHANSSSLEEHSSGGGGAGPLAQIIQCHHPPIIVEFHQIPTRGTDGNGEQDPEDQNIEIVAHSSESPGDDTSCHDDKPKLAPSDSMESLDSEPSENQEHQRLMQSCENGLELSSSKNIESEV